MKTASDYWEKKWIFFQLHSFTHTKQWMSVSLASYYQIKHALYFCNNIKSFCCFDDNVSLLILTDFPLYLSNPPAISMTAWSRPCQKVRGLSKNHALYSNIEGPYVASIHVVPELKTFSSCWWIFGAHQNCLVSWRSWKWGFNIHVITFCCSKSVIICRASAGTWCWTTLACPIKVISTKTLPTKRHRVSYQRKELNQNLNLSKQTFLLLYKRQTTSLKRTFGDQLLRFWEAVWLGG